MVSVKVLGTGCKKCQNLENKVREIVTSNNIDATVEKVTDIQEMVNYGIMNSRGTVPPLMASTNSKPLPASFGSMRSQTWPY